MRWALGNLLIRSSEHFLLAGQKLSTVATKEIPIQFKTPTSGNCFTAPQFPAISLNCLFHLQTALLLVLFTITRII